MLRLKFSHQVKCTGPWRNYCDIIENHSILIKTVDVDNLDFFEC